MSNYGCSDTLTFDLNHRGFYIYIKAVLFSFDLHAWSFSNKNPKYNRSFDMKLLRNELNRLISFVKEKKYEKIDNQIKKVDDKFIDLEIYIQEKELSNAKKEANKILKGLKNTSYKENLKQEISNLKLSLQKNNIIDIRQKIDLLRKKEVALKKDLIKQNDSINTIKSNDEEPQKNE